MISTLRLPSDQNPKSSIAAYLIGAGIAALVGLAAFLLFGTPATQTTLAYGIVGMLTLGPLVAYIALKRPILAFAAYTTLVPLENLIHISGVGTLARLLGAATGVVLLFSLMIRRRTVSPDRSVYFWALFLVWMCATLFWALDPTYYGTINIIQIAQLWALYLLVAITPMTAAELNLVLIGSALGGFIGGAYSVNQYLHGARPASGTWTRLYLSGGDSLIDSNHFAAAMQMPIAVTWMAVLQMKKQSVRIVLLGLLAVMFVGILLGASRGGIVAILVLSAYFGIRARKLREMLIVLGLGLVSSLFFPSVWARFADPSQGEGSGRTDIWKVGLYAFRHHWLGGVGAGNFQVAYDQSLLKVYQPEFQGWARPSHNIIIGVSTELGIIGLALLVLAGVRQFQSMRIIPRSSPLFSVRIALEGAMLALVAESMFIDTLWYKYVWLTFAVMAALRSTYLTSLTAPSLTHSEDTTL